jgi:hypothetical protein
MIAFLMMIFRADEVTIYLFYGQILILSFIFIACFWRHFVRIRRHTRNSVFDITIITTSLALSSLFLCPRVNAVFFGDTDATSISSPLKNGTYFVVQGGRNFLVNDHRSYPKATAQKFAVDLVKLSYLGRSNSEIFSQKKIEDYYIYGTPVYSPCDGRIIFGADGFSDLASETLQERYPAGNYLAIACDTQITVVVAHLQRGLFSKVGDRVNKHTELGLVGNSGNSTEPHLHIHAISGIATTDQEALFTGNGIPLQINGNYLYKNSVLRLRVEKEASDDK